MKVSAPFPGHEDAGDSHERPDLATYCAVSVVGIGVRLRVEQPRILNLKP